MHILQQKILDLSDRVNIGDLTLRDIGIRVGDTHPQKIKHHLDQLFKKNFLKKAGNVISRVSSHNKNDFYFIPVVGSANCGRAVTFADENIEGYLTVSPKILNETFKPQQTFAIRALGDSMNMAMIKGEHINDGDFVIVDSEQRDLSYYDNKYVLSIIGGMANIKKLVRDNQNNRIMLVSESRESYPPIYIHDQDFSEYMVNGVVTQVIKSPELKPRFQS